MSAPKRYRKKPVVIEAIQVSDYNLPELFALADEAEEEITVLCCATEDGAVTNLVHSVKIHTLEGTMTANLGDFIIKGINGKFCLCRSDVFWATYEEVK